MTKKTTVRRRPSEPDYNELMRREGGHLGFGSDAAFRNMLDNIHLRCSVEAEGTHQYGDVTGIIRDRYGIPVAVKVHYESECANGEVVSGVDYIAMADITFWEPYDSWVPNENYEDDSSIVDDLLESGYVWNDDMCCYYNAETGDRVVW